ncbi:hypothetical protein LZ30DRAFT_609175, partial [Colletotrichum cereale]
GSAKDYAKTVVMLPISDGAKVVKPADNKGRPRLLVTKSGPVEFRVVGYIGSFQGVEGILGLRFSTLITHLLFVYTPEASRPIYLRIQKIIYCVV